MIKRLFQWLDASTCNVMAGETIKSELNKAGFSEIKQSEKWDIKKGGKYYVIKNGTAIFAFVVGNKPISEQGFRIISAHSDSPCFKIKPNAEIYGEGGVVSLNVEKYGGGILYTWFDRPLSISGRIVVKGDSDIYPQIIPVDLKNPIATIPHLAIHFNRAVNDGNPLSVQKDMKPVVGIFSKNEIEDFKSKGGLVRVLVANHLNIKPEDIIEYELKCNEAGMECKSTFLKELTQGKVNSIVVQPEYNTKINSFNIDNIRNATIADMVLNKINKNTAKNIYNYFHEN